MNIVRELRQACLLSAVLLVLCGGVYPYLVSGLGQYIFPVQAAGSLVVREGKAVGSILVGQQFSDPRFMQGRPSAVGYNTYRERDAVDGTYTGLASGSSNLAASNPALVRRVQQDMAAFLASNPGVRAQDIPADLLTASGSGLDPHISPAAARLQIAKLVRTTGLQEQTLERIVLNNSTGKLWGIFGEERVHVLGVNLEIAQALGLLATQ